MKKQGFSFLGGIVLFGALVFSPVLFSPHEAEGAVGARCETRLDNTDANMSSGVCVLSGNCRGGDVGAVSNCGSGEVCCVQAAGTVACQTRLDNSDPTLSTGTCVAPGGCTGGDTGGSSNCPSGQLCCVGGTGGTNVGGTCASRGGACRTNGCISGTETPGGACTAAEGSGTCCVRKTAATGSQATINFSNPLEFNSVEEVLSSLLSTLQGIIVTLALVFLVIGAILYIISGGNEERMNTGKKAITAAMIGLAIGLAAPSFLKEIGSVLGWGPVDDTALAGAKTLTQIALDVLHFLLSIVGILAIIMLLIGGLTYLTAAGDENRIETGKKIVTYSIIGIIIAFGSLVIVTQIANFFT